MDIVEELIATAEKTVELVGSTKTGYTVRIIFGPQGKEPISWDMTVAIDGFGRHQVETLHGSEEQGRKTLKALAAKYGLKGVG